MCVFIKNPHKIRTASRPHKYGTEQQHMLSWTTYHSLRTIVSINTVQ